MSHKTEHRNKPLTITIDNKKCSGVYGESILEIARRNDIYIPTMCYLTKVSPIASCRMCIVEVEGVDGDVLSCQEKAVDGAIITTNSNELEHKRTNIMKMYDVNHPLQCGVCDKSGECDLQNKTLEFAVSSQDFAIKEVVRKNKKWGILGYDPSLCIMCEKCVHTCNEIIGTAALYIKPGGYKSTIDMKYTRCEQCGDCISVCPVGALVSNEYKYSANAWESNKIPATCSHCSSGCSLNYDVKNGKITRVTNDFEFTSLCGAGRFGFGFENNSISSKDDLNKAVEAIRNANTIKFDSYITSEEAYILQKLKDKLGIKLVNEDAKNYQTFLNTFNLVTSKSLYSATNETISKSDAIIMIGTRISRDNPVVKYNVNIATKKQGAQFIYMHPIDDIALQDKYTQFVKYEASSEEAILAMLAYYLIDEIPLEYKGYFADLDIGYLSGESSVGEEEFIAIKDNLTTKKNKTLILGEDLYGHKNAKNIAKLAGLIDKYTNFDVLLMPSSTNTLGVSLICQLDDETTGKVVGYNQLGDFIISNDGEGDFNVPSLNQQEGTFVNLDLKVVNTNAALPFDGFCLNDIANEILDHKKKHTIDYTVELFNNIKFDDLRNGYDKYGNDLRGYKLARKDLEEQTITLENIDQIDTYNGSVIYRCESMHQFNSATSKSLLLRSDSHLRGSKSFAIASKISDGDMISIVYQNQKIVKKFKIDSTIKGTIALCPTFDDGIIDNIISEKYRFKQVLIQKEEVNG